jgi:sugar phosphate isomerase/epimerase
LGIDIFRNTVNHKIIMFPLVIQIPGIAASSEEAFIDKLSILSRHGFMGIEYQVMDFEKDRIDLVKAMTAEYALIVTRIATGTLASREGLSLSDDGRSGRDTVARMKEFIDYAADLKAPLILGFIKGPSAMDKEKAKAGFLENMSEIVPLAARKGIGLVIEATNHYESAVANTLAEAVELVRSLDYSGAQILPDTYHMNIEEADMIGSLHTSRGFFDAIHLSDNNRYLPGYGGIDFKRVIAALLAGQFSGYLGLEGNIKKSFAEDMELFCDLYSVIRRGLGG